MKRVIQLVLFCIVLISIFLFNKIYFQKEEQEKTAVLESQKKPEPQNNIIKNLKYEIKLENDNFYVVTADTSELSYVNNSELVKMQQVVAKFTDKKKTILTIISDEALYNNFNHNTQFKKNVVISYINNKIFSDKIDINFQENTVKIFDNVKFIGEDGIVNSDNIVINLITKKMNIYMNDKKKNVKVTKFE